MVFWNRFEALKKNLSGVRFGPYLGFLLLATVSITDAYSQIQIVNCDAPVQSRKRGIACNALSSADFEALAPGVSWYYNWGATPLTKPADVTMDFIPMAWNGNSSFQTQISSYLAAGNRPWRVFALNEPNLAGQAFMTPSNSAVTFLQVKAICDPYNIPVIAPHMAIGSATGDSITAYDPIQGSNVTYTFQEPFLSAFLYYCGATPPTGMSTHSYGGYGEITWILGTMHTDFPTQKIWLTEFNPSNAGATNDDLVLANLIPAVDYCERTPWVEGYSWFKERISGDSHNSLLGNSGVLTAAGQAYVQMPVHDTNLYYRIPGRLQAERYVVMNQMNIAPTTDVDGLADMITTVGASLDYNLQVDSPGNYLVSFRVAGAVGVIDIYSGSTLLGKAVATQGAWSTFSTTIALPAGAQTLHIVFTGNNQRFNWMEFVATNNPPVLAAIPNQTILAGRTLQITNSASDPDVPPQLLTYSLLNAPAGATIDTNSGVFTWRPAIAQSPSTQTVTVVVSDNGTPPLTAAQSFTTTVIQPAMPAINTISVTNGQFGFWINGDTGPDYIIQASTNLTFWYPISTNDSPAIPYFWADTNLVSYPFLFYRISLGP
ncbi:MAG TPA: glycosyl hydrolase [Verrucomicrobiae bacterium]|nr:glycosyl hydrolase [Verrucomicrobiae bacterium]